MLVLIPHGCDKDFKKLSNIWVLWLIYATDQKPSAYGTLSRIFPLTFLHKTPSECETKALRKSCASRGFSIKPESGITSSITKSHSCAQVCSVIPLPVQGLRIALMIYSHDELYCRICWKWRCECWPVAVRGLGLFNNSLRIVWLRRKK